MTSTGHGGDDKKRKREEESVIGLTPVSKKSFGETARAPDDEPRPGTSQDPAPSDRGFDIRRLTFHQILGRGFFGTVVLASFPGRNTLVAVKVLKRGNTAVIMRERRILLATQDCPYIVHLYATQQSAALVYYITEYLSGGSLENMVRMCGRLDIDNVRFYAAEIVCGLQFLHRRGIVHRDIKLDNIMLDGDGHIRLIDLGRAEDGVTSSDKISGATGTSQFKYGVAHDWGRLGIVISWMATGQYFSCHSSNKFPSWLDADTKHLVEGLLCRDPEKRLGVCEDIRAHPFFNTIDWEALEQKRLRPPFKPFQRVLENKNLQWPEDGTPLHPLDGFSFASPSWIRMTRRFRL